MPLSFDEIASRFDDQRGLPIGTLRAFTSFVDDIAHGRRLSIIEPGIGTGRVALPLAVGGHRIMGVDVSRPMLNACATRLDALGISGRVTLVQGDATDLPCSEDAFDVGLFASLLYLVTDWEAVLDELARVVRPEGAVIWLRERTELGEALARWDDAWRTSVETLGFAHQSISPTDDEVVETMRRHWLDTDIRSLSSWSFGQTVEEGRRDYGARLRALYPEIPDDVWSVLVSRFIDSSHTAFPDPGERLDGTVVLEAVVAWT